MAWGLNSFRLQSPSWEPPAQICFMISWLVAQLPAVKARIEQNAGSATIDSATIN